MNPQEHGIPLKRKYLIKFYTPDDLKQLKLDRVLSKEDQLLIKMQGFQGFDILEETGDTFYAAFNPNQIKSATDNNGMFSTENDDIQMAVENNSEKNNIFAQNSYI